jgi:hypothetical protein
MTTSITTLKDVEFSRVRGVFAEDNDEYVNHQKILRENIMKMTLEKAFEIGISRRVYFDLKQKIRNNISFTVKKRTLRKLLKI